MTERLVLLALILAPFASFQPVLAGQTAESGPEFLSNLIADLKARQRELSNLKIRYARVVTADTSQPEKWTNEYHFLNGDLQSTIACEKPLESGRVLRVYSSSKRRCFRLERFEGKDQLVICGLGEAEREGVDRHHQLADLWLAQPGLHIPLYSVIDLLDNKGGAEPEVTHDAEGPYVRQVIMPFSEVIDRAEVKLRFSSARPYVLSSADIDYELSVDGKTLHGVSRLTFDYEVNANSKQQVIQAARWSEEDFLDGDSIFHRVTECAVTEYLPGEVGDHHFQLASFGVADVVDKTTAASSRVQVTDSADGKGNLELKISNLSQMPVTLRGSNQLGSCYKWGCLGDLKEPISISGGETLTLQLTYTQREAKELTIPIDLHFEGFSTTIEVALPQTSE